MDPSDRYRLQSFRRVAQQVYDASIVSRGENIGLVLRDEGFNEVGVYVEVFDDEPFRSLAIAIRLAYMNVEPTNFNSICNLLYLAGDDAIKDRVKGARKRYSEVLRGEGMQISLGSDEQSQSLSRRDVFEHWLYGITFHQEADRHAVVQQLQSKPADFLWQVHGTALELARSILQLDGVVADLLGERQLKQRPIE